MILSRRRRSGRSPGSIFRTLDTRVRGRGAISQNISEQSAAQEERGESGQKANRQSVHKSILSAGTHASGVLKW